jgi:hypothetical protein
MALLFPHLSIAFVAWWLINYNIRISTRDTCSRSVDFSIQYRSAYLSSYNSFDYSSCLLIKFWSKLIQILGKSEHFDWSKQVVPIMNYQHFQDLPSTVKFDFLAFQFVGGEALHARFTNCICFPCYASPMDAGVSMRPSMSTPWRFVKGRTRSQNRRAWGAFSKCVDEWSLWTNYRDVASWTSKGPSESLRGALEVPPLGTFGSRGRRCSETLRMDPMA